MKKWTITIIGALALSLTHSMLADAQTTLDYAGGTLYGSYEYSGPGGSGVSDFAIGPVSGDLVLNSPLAFDASNQVVTPISWNFDAVGMSSDVFAQAAGQSNEHELFSFTTSNGAITSWDVEIGLDQPSVGGAAGSISFDSYGSGAGQGLAGTDTFSLSETSPDSTQIITHATNASGSWTQTVQAPELDPTSAVSAFSFLAGCIAVLRGRRRGGPHRLAS